MAVGTRIKILAGLRRLRGSVPTKRARSSRGRFLPAGEEVNCFWLEHRRAAAQQAMCELGEIAGSCEHSSMTGDSAHHESVLIMHLALDHAIADLLTIRSRNDLPLHPLGRIKEGGVHLQPVEDIELAKCFHGRSRDPLQRFTKKNEPDVA